MVFQSLYNHNQHIDIDNQHININNQHFQLDFQLDQYVQLDQHINNDNFLVCYNYS